ncbi:hypothetical protein RRG08_027685 [Elysia crispata]|uniref:Uncharacterized protein n=1 Tax=Elysia crispata TaxID=231223 RepID=A0AAE0XM33_9GAST|nr:hypothetical protein RRG08_027685 [Elysia crispata]
MDSHAQLLVRLGQGEEPRLGMNEEERKRLCSESCHRRATKARLFSRNEKAKGISGPTPGAQSSGGRRESDKTRAMDTYVVDNTRELRSYTLKAALRSTHR